MSDAQGEIRAGERWAAVLDAVTDAVERLSGDLSDEDLERGWTDELRSSVLEDLRRVESAIAVNDDPGAALEDHVGVEEVEEGDDDRVSAIFLVDVVLAELGRAETALRGAHRLERELAAASTSSDEGAGFDDGVRLDVAARAATLRDTLASGSYLTYEEMDPWVALLSRHGFERAAPRPTFGAALPPRVGFDGTGLVAYPKGKRWEHVALFDGALVDVARTDVTGEDTELLDVDRDEPPIPEADA